MMARNEWLLHKIKETNNNVDFDDADFGDYLQEISTYHADRLIYEPNRLAEEKSNLEEETENLTFSNYKTFIQVANCSKQIFNDFVHIQHSVDDLLGNLPALDDECQRFTQEAHKINAKRSQNSLALRKHTQLLEILEIPQVMDTCVRAGYYEEALELAQYAAKLERRLGHITLIQSISKEVKNQRELLLENLLDQLNSNLNLSTCLKVVSYLRRLNVFTESELRIKFLMLRGQWLDNMIAAVPNTNAYMHVTRVMELLRVNLFDVISQYKAAFPDEDSSHTSSAAFFHPSASFHESSGLHTAAPIVYNSASIFSAWLFAKADRFVQILRSDMEQGFENRLDSVLAQCMHFGLSLSRVGTDIRHLLIPVFEDHVRNYFLNSINAATIQFLKQFIHEFESVTNLPKISTQHGSNSNRESTTAATTVVDPPLSLLQYPSLAVYCNAVLTVFNNCRPCLPVNLAPILLENLNYNVKSIADQLLHYFQTIQENSDKRTSSIDEFCKIFAFDFLPFLNVCLSVLLPEKQLCDSVGLQLAEFDQIKNLTRINVDTLKIIWNAYLPIINDEHNDVSLEDITLTPVYAEIPVV